MALLGRAPRECFPLDVECDAGGSVRVVRNGVLRLSRCDFRDNAVVAQSGVVAVNLCRARQISKPFGAKPGLVSLRGDVTRNPRASSQQYTLARPRSY